MLRCHCGHRVKNLFEEDTFILITEEYMRYGNHTVALFEAAAMPWMPGKGYRIYGCSDGMSILAHDRNDAIGRFLSARFRSYPEQKPLMIQEYTKKGWWMWKGSK